MNPCINVLLIILLVFVSIMTWIAWKAIAANPFEEIDPNSPNDDISCIYRAYIRILADATIITYIYITGVTAVLCLAYFEYQRWCRWEVAIYQRTWLPARLRLPTWVRRRRTIAVEVNSKTPRHGPGLGKKSQQKRKKPAPEVRRGSTEWETTTSQPQMQDTGKKRKTKLPKRKKEGYNPKYEEVLADGTPVNMQRNSDQAIDSQEA
ncbi:hypothetical protein BGX38DRAFT_1146105 [Terfezia claveryi]|nr:hypothetical protein BGX38DRAFT_1146105 [Terfezia claveryi]